MSTRRICQPEEYHRKSEFGHPHREDAGAPFEWFTVAHDNGLTDKVAKSVVDSVMSMARGHLHCNGSFKLGGSIKLALTITECGEDGKISGTWVLQDDEQLPAREEDTCEDKGETLGVERVGVAPTPSPSSALPVYYRHGVTQTPQSYISLARNHHRCRNRTRRRSLSRRISSSEEDTVLTTNSPIEIDG